MDIQLLLFLLYCLFRVSMSAIQLELKGSPEPLCLYQTVELQCNHVDAPNTIWVHDTKANWKLDGNVISPNGTLFHTHQPAMNITNLVVSLQPSFFYPSGHQEYRNISCFLRVINGTELESNEVTIVPLSGPYVPMIQEVYPQPWSANVRIVHNSTCFDASTTCSLEYTYSWQPTNMGSQIESVKSKAFTVILQDLLPSTQYELNVTANAVCDDNRLYPSDVSSAIFTTESVNDLGSFITIQSNVTSACFGKIFKMTCNHPDILAMHNQSDVFIDSYANWKRDGMILAIDDVTYSVEQHRTYSTLTVNFSPDDFSIPGSSNFSCYLRGKGNVQYERLNASVDIPGKYKNVHGVHGESIHAYI
jgi:hypothetical protein